MLKKKEILEAFKMLGLSRKADRKQICSLGELRIAETPENMGKQATPSEQIEIVADNVTRGITSEGEGHARLERSAG